MMSLFLQLLKKSWWRFVPKLPTISGKKAIKAFGKMGYLVDRQTGSHLILRNKEQPHRRLTIPNHKEISSGTLRKIITQAGLTKSEFIKLLK